MAKKPTVVERRLRDSVEAEGVAWDEYSGNFEHLLEGSGLSLAKDGRLIATLLRLHANHSAVEAMRASWTEEERERWNHPLIVWRKFEQLTRAPK